MTTNNLSASFGGMILGGALSLIGIILAIFGAIRGGKNKKEQIENKALSQNENNNNKFHTVSSNDKIFYSIRTFLLQS